MRENIYIIEEIPISLNKIYSTGKKGIRFITKEAFDFKQRLSWYFCEQDYLNKRDKLKVEFYALEIIVCLEKEKLFFKNGNLRKCDLDNMVKLIQDALFSYLEEDDSKVIKLKVEKRLANKNQIIIKIKEDCLGKID